MQNAKILMLGLQRRKVEEVMEQLRLAQNRCNELYERIQVAYEGEEVQYLLLALSQVTQSITTLQSRCETLDEQFALLQRQQEDMPYDMHSY